MCLSNIINLSYFPYSWQNCPTIC